MKRKLIAAVLALVGAGLAFHAFADPDTEECRTICKKKYDVCLEEGGSDRSEVQVYCKNRYNECFEKCE